jgi:hypothetical protein
MSRGLADSGLSQGYIDKSSSGIWPFLVNLLLGLGQSRKLSSGIVGLGRTQWLIFKFACRGLKNAGNYLIGHWDKAILPGLQFIIPYH